MAKPVRWMQWISDFGGTCTAGPNFAYVLATRALRRAEGLDLSTMRTALSGAEPVDADAFRAFAAEAARFGFRDAALFPAFGMAEVCIAGCFPEPMSGLTTDVIDARVLEHERYAAEVTAGAPNARELAVLGKPVDGLEIRIVDRDDRSGLPRSRGRRAPDHRQLAHRRVLPTARRDGRAHRRRLAAHR